MAMYHFSLHKDKKPDGTSVRGTEHVKYINREGKYEDQDRSPDNFIKFQDGKALLDGQTVLLYESDYGNITNTPDGLKVDGDASEITVDIALMVAHETGSSIELAGSRKFKEMVLNGIIEAGLKNIKLKDEKLQDELDERWEVIKHEQREFRRNGGKISNGPANKKPDFTIASAKGRSLTHAVSLRPPNLCTLSQCGMDDNDNRASAVLLQPDQLDQLEHDRTSLAANVRWDTTGARRGIIREHARRIVNQIENEQDMLLAESHVEYINREKAFAKRGGCIHTENKLPKWARDDAKRFFQMADKYSGKNITRYLEFQFALPNELNMEQNLELIHNFIKKEIPDHYYTFAIHDKVGAMSDGSHNLHVHLMFSPRLIDEAEKEKERGAYTYFRNSKRGAETNKEKRKGGAPMERRLNNIGFLREARFDFAQVTNEILAKYGKPDRVDHRSIKAMREEALMNGDEYMAKLLKRVPEKSIGPYAVNIENSPKVATIKEYRQSRHAVQDLLFDEEKLKKEIDELELREDSEYLQGTTDEFMHTSDYLELEELDEDDLLNELKADFLEAMHDLAVAERAIVWTEDAINQAKAEFLPDDKKETWQKYHEVDEELEHWEIFYNSIDPDESEPEYLALLPELQHKKEDLKRLLDEMQPDIDEMEKDLAQPETKSRLQTRIHNLLQEDKQTRDEYRTACQHVRATLTSLKSGLSKDHEEINKQQYSVKELNDIYRKRYFAAKREYEQARKEEGDARKQYISPERATLIAENQFVQGDWKTWRNDDRELKKKEQYLANDMEKWEKERQSLAGLTNGSMEHTAKKAELFKAKSELDVRQSSIESARDSLNIRYTALRACCDTPDAQAKIKDIAMGILRKNTKQAQTFNAAHHRTELAYNKMQVAKDDFDTVRERRSEFNEKTAFRTGGSGGGNVPNRDNDDLPGIIAAALKNDTVAVNIVERNDTGMPMDWKLMSVFDRDEMKAKSVDKYI